MKAIKTSGKRCALCKRGGLVGNIRSKSNIATKRKQNVNLQTKHIDGKKLKVCTKCIRTASKQKKVVVKTAK